MPRLEPLPWAIAVSADACVIPPLASFASLALRMKPLHGKSVFYSYGLTSRASTNARKTRPSLPQAGSRNLQRGTWNGPCPLRD